MAGNITNKEKISSSTKKIFFSVSYYLGHFHIFLSVAWIHSSILSLCVFLQIGAGNIGLDHNLYDYFTWLFLARYV